MLKFDYSKLTGDIITKDEFSYEADRKAWNRAIEKYPLVIVFCKNNEDVKNAILWATENDISIRIRSGRHHYEGYSTGNDVIIIDVSNMNDIYVDDKNNLVQIQAGVRNRELYEELGNNLYPFPGGGCPTVGVVGFTLGGGWGYSSRLLGLGCDNLIELEMINYKGELIIANDKINSDLFWACKGAGSGNFGVITSMKFNIPKEIKNATLVNIDYPNINLNDSINLVKTWQNLYKNLDRRANFKFVIYNSKERGRGIKITGLFYGNTDELNKILLPIRSIPASMNIELKYMTVLEANREIQNSHPDYEKYKSGGRFVFRDFNDSEIENLINITSKRPEGSEYVAISFYGLGGAILDKKKESASFNYRDANFILGFQSVWEENLHAPINREWLQNKFQYIKSITKGSFINFPISNLDNYEEEYYGENINKLRKIKTKYDPENIFTFPQGINSK